MMDELFVYRLKNYCNKVGGEIEEMYPELLVCKTKNSEITLSEKDFLTIDSDKTNINLLPIKLQTIDDFKNKNKKVLQARTNRNYVELFEDGSIYLKENSLSNDE